MNFERKYVKYICSFCALLCLLFFVVGCGDPALTTGEKLSEFEQAGPILPEIDINKLLRSRSVNTGQYRLIAGDLLEVHIPSVLQDVTAENSGRSEEYLPHLCRVFDDGNIILPLIGKINAEGKTLSQLEKSIIDAYYPRYSLTAPSIVSMIIEYKTFKVSVTGAVAKPGVYELRNDQMSIVSLIMQAEGIVEDGAAVISVHQPQTKAKDDIVKETETESSQAKLSFVPINDTFGTMQVKNGSEMIYSEKIDITNSVERSLFMVRFTEAHPEMPKNNIRKQISDLSEILKTGSGDKTESDDNGLVAQQQAKPLLLPVKGLNVPFADVALTEGCRVEVEALNPEVFTVVGLVKKSGAFPYPPNVKYNLLQALAFAGGVNEIADPRCVRVYRQKADGGMIDATFAINGTSPVGAPNISIKPGDIVSVEQTLRTRTNLLLSEILAIRVGAAFNYQQLQGKSYYRKIEE